MKTLDIFVFKKTVLFYVEVAIYWSKQNEHEHASYATASFNNAFKSF